MKKLLYIAPHLSTGGLPQYLTKKVELLNNDYEIHLVEWQDVTGGRLVVTKNKIKALLPKDRFYTLGEDKTEILNIINNIKPDIIHLEEIPELAHFPRDIIEQIYKTDRPYKLVETSHDSSFDTNTKQFYPDMFMFVSQWQIDQYVDIDIPKVLVEYPIEYIKRPNRVKALKKLGLDPNKKHVLHVGLFTPRKNQSEFFEYARMLPDVEFHCVGNQADNFKWYWEPLMNNKPDNVTWWNERTDVDNFYQSMDLFLFTSRGSANDKETMPLVIREAISYQIPLLIYNLEVYQNYFDKFDSVNYLDFDSKERNKNIILKSLNQKVEINPLREAFVISTYPISKSIIDTTTQCIKAAKKTGRKIILTSHIPIPVELQNLVDYCVVDNNNILTKHSYYCNFWWTSPNYKVHLNLRGEDNDVYHGPTVYTNYYNGASLASDLDLDKVYYLNYDYILNSTEYIDSISNILENKEIYFGEYQASEGRTLYTYFMASNPKYLINKLPYISDAKSYDNLQTVYNSESNGLENLFYHIFKNKNEVRFESREQFEEDTKQYFDFQDYSRVEYFTVLGTNIPNRFIPWVYISNSKDSRIINYKVYKNDTLFREKTLEVNNKFHYWDNVEYNLKDTYKVVYEILDSESKEILDTKVINIDKEYIENQLSKNGNFEWTKSMKGFGVDYPKIKLMHLVTEPDTNEKEIRSVENIKDFCSKTGIIYEQRINKIWTDLPPKENCNRPNDIQDKPGYYKLAPGHYGCYVAHKNAIQAKDNNDYDYVLIFEGDVIIDSDYNELYDSLLRFNKIAKENDQDIIGFGNPTKDRNLNGPKIEDIHTNVTPFVPAQSYLITKNKVNKLANLLNTTKWDAFDLWACNVAKLKIGTADKIYTKHLPGFSIIEQEFKGMDEHSPEIYAK
jgi:glycosyltransferase involved in cell wall biosynthesis